MSAPNKRQLVGTIAALQGVIQDMFAAYANDVAMGRAERMEALLQEGTKIAQPIINAFPYEYLLSPEAQRTPAANPIAEESER